jgi:4'-phosphopantetheinyl transferase EntD
MWEPAQTDSILSRDPAIMLRFMPALAGDPLLLHPVEAGALSKEAVISRQREFAAGRACAAQAMQDLGLAPMPIAMASDRSPVWPDGVVGSISHSRTLAGAALALRSSCIVSIGLDIEDLEPLADDLIEEICTPNERRWLASHNNAEHHLLLAKAIFSAKEAVYKCQYPIAHETFGFEMIEIELQIADNRFLGHFCGNAGPLKRGSQLAGEIWLSDNHIVSLVRLCPAS